MMIKAESVAPTEVPAAEELLKVVAPKFAVVQEYEITSVAALPAALDHIYEHVEEGTFVKVSMNVQLADQLLQTQVTYMERLLELERTLVHAGIKSPDWDMNVVSSPAAAAVVAADMYISQALLGEGTITPRPDHE